MSRPAARWLAAAALALGGCAPGTEPGPAASGPDAADPRVLARTLAQAAEARDYGTLASHMAEQFSYSFGREPSRAGAIETFRDEPGRLDTLAKLLRGDCAWADRGGTRWYICPVAAAQDDAEYYGWRAGFRQQNDSAWELAWFIAGD